MSIEKFDDPKDPLDITDHQLDFSQAIPSGDVLAAINAVTLSAANTTAVADPGTADLALVAQLYSGTLATVWLSGGKDGWRYLVGVTVTTAGGRTFHRSAYLLVKSL